MTFYSVDVEADGPAPGLYSMVSIGVVAVRGDLSDRFYREIKPISDDWVPEALAVGGFERSDLLEQGVDANDAMADLRAFLGETSNGRPVCVSDNPAFDFAFVNYYLHGFNAENADPANPFGHSARRIGDLWAGLQGKASTTSSWKKLRETSHTHNALDDAVGNAEALLQFADHGLTISFE